MISRMQIYTKVFNLPSAVNVPPLPMEEIKAFLINDTIGFDVAANKEDVPPAAVPLKINSKNGISMPKETIENMMESTTHKK